MPNIKLQSSDKVIFDTDVEIAECSGTIKIMLEDMGYSYDSPLPLPHVHSDILRMVLQWAKYHNETPIPLEDDEDKEKRIDVIKSWDADFLKVDQETLIKLIDAAHCLDIKGLLYLTCIKLAKVQRKETPEKICKTSNIKSDLSSAKAK